MGKTKQGQGKMVDEWVNNSYRRRQIRKLYFPPGVTVKCWICGMDGANQLDHKKPRAKYPELVWELSNIVPAHDDCNNAKSDGDGAPSLGVPSEDW